MGPPSFTESQTLGFGLDGVVFVGRAPHKSGDRASLSPHQQHDHNDDDDQKNDSATYVHVRPPSCAIAPDSRTPSSWSAARNKRGQDDETGSLSVPAPEAPNRSGVCARQRFAEEARRWRPWGSVSRHRARPALAGAGGYVLGSCSSSQSRVTTVPPPDRAPTLNAAPASAARSRIERRPRWPRSTVSGSKPCPSSSTRRWT